MKNAFAVHTWQIASGVLYLPPRMGVWGSQRSIDIDNASTLGAPQTPSLSAMIEATQVLILHSCHVPYRTYHEKRI